MTRSAGWRLHAIAGASPPRGHFAPQNNRPHSPSELRLFYRTSISNRFFDNQQNKFEPTKPLSGETPLNAYLYKKGATIVAPKHHTTPKLRLGVKGFAFACRHLPVYFLISLWRVLRLSDGLYFIFSTFLPSGLRGLRVVI